MNTVPVNKFVYKDATRNPVMFIKYCGKLPVNSATFEVSSFMVGHAGISPIYMI